MKNINALVEEFDELWKHHADWVGSGFRYNDSSFTAKGLEETRPMFEKLIRKVAETALKECRPEEREYTKFIGMDWGEGNISARIYNQCCSDYDERVNQFLK